jgi:hypothetical protein
MKIALFLTKATRSSFELSWTQAMLWSALVMVVTTIMAFGSAGSLAGYYLVRQDLPVAMLATAFFLLARHASKAPPTQLISQHIPIKLIISGGVLAILAGGWVGANLIMHGYQLSRDEQMAVQDAAIFANGRFMVPLPSQWHPFIDALGRDFNSITFRPEMTISGYRPINALAHAIMGMAGLMKLTAPLFAAVGLVATWRVAVRFWPNEPAIHWIAILFYLSSAQMWAASMTTYAMSMLLGLNMTWLALFLRKDPLGYVGAALVGFFAIGAHQVPYHLMFAAPFIATGLMEGRWRITATFFLLYIGLAVLWLRYEDVVALIMGGDVLKTATASLGDTIGGYIPDQRGPGNVAWTAANIVRLIAWQHLLLLPLTIVASVMALRQRNIMIMAMLAACALPLAVKFMQVAFQGHGWGYRYLHGSLGLLCLLAAAGWRELQQRGMAYPLHLKIGTSLTVAVAAPWLLWNAAQFNGAYANVDKKLRTINSDVVIIDTRAAAYAGDLVLNRPTMDNRPIRMAAAAINDTDINMLCKMGTIGFLPKDFLAPIQLLFGMPVGQTTDYETLQQKFAQRCPSALRNTD